VSSRVAHVPPVRLACRVIALDGYVSVAGQAGQAGQAGEAGGDAAGPPLLLQGLVAPEAWLDLPAGARFVAKDPRTTRETTFRGPGRVRACVGYAEESWLAGGSFESTVGAGESPGAEEWVVTPFGVVRYVAAKLSLAVRARGAEVSVESGVAFLWTTASVDWKSSDPRVDAGALEESWLRLAPGRAKVAPGDRPPLGPLDEARRAVQRCADEAKSTRALTTQVMAPGGADAATIGQQVTARRTARAACAVATLRVQTLPALPEVAGLSRQLAEADAAWSALTVAAAPSP
jgi:hypothetical protein